MTYIPSSPPLHEVSGYLVLFNVTFLLVMILPLNFSWQIRCKCLQTICLEGYKESANVCAEGPYVVM